MATFTGTSNYDYINAGYVSPNVAIDYVGARPGAEWDTIYGNGGDDELNGEGGDDFIYTGAGTDIA